MSVWYKPVEQITAANLDDFLRLGQQEGMRLDYKAEVPKDLAKLVAAFANTLGGIMVLGVDADKGTNRPMWPPAPGGRGMPAKAGIEEQIISICRDNIYPPVRPLVSPLLENTHLPGHVLAIVRVDESQAAPHATNGGRYIYERTGCLTTPYDVANIDRIQHLLARRVKVEQEREAHIETSIRRARGRMSDPLPFSARWVTVIPMFPWRDLCAPQRCRDFHDKWHARQIILGHVDHWAIQRVPDGSFALGQSRYSSGEVRIVACTGLNAKGLVFALASTEEMQTISKPNGRLIGFETSRKFVEDVFSAARDFYNESDVEVPGLIALTIGFQQVKNVQMVRTTGRGVGPRYLDEQFRHQVVVPVNQLLDDPKRAAEPLLEQVAYGFDALPLPGV